MAAAFRSATIATTGGGVTTLPLNTPAGVINGDVLVVDIVAAAIAPTAAPTITPPSGWTVQKSDTFASAGGAVNNRAEIYTRIANGEPASNNWTIQATTAGTVAQCAAVVQGNTTTPMDLAPSINTGNGTTVTALGLTTTVDDVLLLFMAGTNGGGATYTAPAGMAEGQDSLGFTIAHVLQAAAGASGNKAATASVTGDWYAHLVAVRSAPAAKKLAAVGVG